MLRSGVCRDLTHVMCLKDRPILSVSPGKETPVAELRLLARISGKRLARSCETYRSLCLLKVCRGWFFTRQVGKVA